MSYAFSATGTDMKKSGFSRYLSLYPILFMVAPTLHAGSALAGDKHEQDLARSALQSGQAIPFATVQSRLMEECQCQVLEAKLHSEKKHDDKWFIYEIKAITPNGRIVKLEMDARSGNILRMKNKGWKN
ncbi:peptidase [Brenneria roseae subsp. americana]|uniref:Peptidase n=2 Tax=Brenneria roseae TaxID=1509241 RepID=A0A2U1TSH9_9GAMM|nr:peptidase [Brenneria roseae subsp. americana]